MQWSMPSFLFSFHSIPTHNRSYAPFFRYHKQIAVCMRAVKYRMISQFTVSIAHALHTLLALFQHFWYFDRIQTTIYRIVLRQFPLAFFLTFFSFAVAALSFVCLVFVCSSKFHWICLTKENSTNAQNDANKRLISLSLFLHLARFFLFFRSCNMFYFELAGFSVQRVQFVGRLFCYSPHNQCVLLSVDAANVIAVVAVASCSRNSLLFLRFVKMTLLFQFYHCLCRICNTTKKEREEDGGKKSNLFSVNEAVLLLCFVLFMFNLFSYCLCVSPLSLLIIVFLWKQLYACEGEIMINWE